MERVALLAILLAGFSTHINAKGLNDSLSKWDFYFRPVVGLNVSAMDQAFEPSFGRDHFSKHYPSTNVYVGALIHRYIGVELGYENLYRQQYIQQYPEVDGATAPVLGFVDPGNAFPLVYVSNAFSQGWHLNVLGLFPIACKTQLTASIGLGRVKMYYDTVPMGDPVQGATPVIRWSSDRRTLMQMGVGVRQMITAHFGLRMEATWAQTSKLGATIPSLIGANAADPQLPSDNYTVKPKNRYGAGVGFFLQW